MSRKGFSLVELLLALTLAVFAISVLGGAILYSNESLTTGALQVQADWRARECLNVVRWIRDIQGWSELGTGTYGLASPSGSWELVASPDVSGRFTRTVTVGAESDHVRLLTCEVAWTGQFGDRTVSYQTELGTWPTE